MLYDVDKGIAALKAQISVLQAQLNALDGAKATLSDLQIEPIDAKLDGAGGKSTEERRTRKSAIMTYIGLFGPIPRAELIEATGIPAGTVSYELNDKTTFIRLPDGKWDLRSKHPDPDPDPDPDPAPEPAEPDEAPSDIGPDDDIPF